MTKPACPVILVDRRNYRKIRDEIVAKHEKCSVLGFDIETHDRRCHKALYDWRKSNKRSGAFDARRTTVTGFSTYAEGDDVAYYVNLNHADVENRLPWADAKLLLDAKPKDVPFVIHNVPFEWRMMKHTYDFDLGETIDTLQLAVSTFGPDEYPLNKLVACLPKWEFTKLVPDIDKAFAGWDGHAELTPRQADLLGKVVGKSSSAEHSYNGLVDHAKYGYGLKALVKGFLDGEIGSFQGLLDQFDAQDMGDLTGEQTAKYGGEDSYWCVKLMNALLLKIRPEALEAFLRTENEMTHLYGEMAVGGARVSMPEVLKAEQVELTNQAEATEKLRNACQAEVQRQLDLHADELDRPEIAEALKTGDEALLLQFGFPTEAPVKCLMKDKYWYSGKPGKEDTRPYEKYRLMAMTWARKDRKPVNPVHYMVCRTILYDLFRLKPIYAKGKLQSDKDCRGTLLETAEGHAKTALEAFSLLAGIDQRLKLYIVPYKALVDPDTGRVYPIYSSMLASRRMAAELPNTMQLGKRGVGQYIRGFYKPDEPTFMNPFRLKQIEPLRTEHATWTDQECWTEWLNQHPDYDPRHGIISIDEKQIELVLVGEASGDPEFKRAYGQIPYRDLHAVAGTAVVRAVCGCPDFSFEDFKALHHGENRRGLAFKDPQGRELDPKAAYKLFRSTEGGKGANFEFWYSNFLSTLASRWNMTSDQAAELAQAYRDQFPVASAWREGLVEQVSQTGYLDLPDGHRRTKFEATMGWAALMQNYFDGFESDAISKFGRKVIQKVQRRAVNQVINSRIQGVCAPVIKESMLKVRNEVCTQLDCRLMFPIHDEIVASVRFDDMWEYMNRVKKIMTTHPRYISNLVQDGSTSIGVTFQPYDKEKAPFGQIEVDEAPADWDWIPEPDIRMNEEQFKKTVEYLKQGAE